MNILVTNDDGIDSHGIVKLAKTAKRFGNVFVVAPDGQRSCISHSMTYGTPIRISRCEFPVDGVSAYKSNGTPADIARVCFAGFLKGKIDVMLAGINDGYNISRDIQYSGTVAAAMEASLFGVHAIAFSQGTFEYGEVVDKYLDGLIEEYINKPLGVNKIWNINFPACKLEECKGVKRDCRVSTDTFYDDGYTEKLVKDGVYEYNIIPKRIWEAEKGSDLAAIIDNYISVGIVNNIG